MRLPLSPPGRGARASGLSRLFYKQALVIPRLAGTRRIIRMLVWPEDPWGMAEATSAVTPLATMAASYTCTSPRVPRYEQTPRAAPQVRRSRLMGRHRGHLASQADCRSRVSRPVCLELDLGTLIALAEVLARVTLATLFWENRAGACSVRAADRQADHRPRPLRCPATTGARPGADIRALPLTA